jgi:ADP-ribosylglycohydrolase
MLPGTLTGTPAGYWTDDTAMAIAVLEVASKEGSLTTPTAIAAVGDRFLEWLQSVPSDIGNHTSAVLRRAGCGAEMTEAAAWVQGNNPSSASNGSLMRTGPVALAHLGNDDELVAAAVGVSGLTHAHPDAVAACVLWTRAIDETVRTGEIASPRVGLHLLDEAKRSYWEQKIDEAESCSPFEFSDNGGVVVALQAAWSAIYSTRYSNNHLDSGLRQAVAIGNDTDTVAAIAGYLLGGCYGVTGVPPEWVSGLAGWPRGYSAEDLEKMAHTTIIRSAYYYT